jgi:hypothetical protein
VSGGKDSNSRRAAAGGGEFDDSASARAESDAGARQRAGGPERSEGRAGAAREQSLRARQSIKIARERLIGLRRRRLQDSNSRRAAAGGAEFNDTAQRRRTPAGQPRTGEARSAENLSGRASYFAGPLEHLRTLWFSRQLRLFAACNRFATTRREQDASYFLAGLLDLLRNCVRILLERECGALVACERLRATCALTPD